MTKPPEQAQDSNMKAVTWWAHTGVTCKKWDFEKGNERGPETELTLPPFCPAALLPRAENRSWSVVCMQGVNFLRRWWCSDDASRVKRMQDLGWAEKHSKLPVVPWNCWKSCWNFNRFWVFQSPSSADPLCIAEKRASTWNLSEIFSPWHIFSSPARSQDLVSSVKLLWSTVKGCEAPESVGRFSEISSSYEELKSRRSNENTFSAEPISRAQHPFSVLFPHFSHFSVTWKGFSWILATWPIEPFPDAAHRDSFVQLTLLGWSLNITDTSETSPWREASYSLSPKE